MRSGPKPLVDERQFVPSTIVEARQLFGALVAVGVGEPKARSIVGALQTLPDRYPKSLGVMMVEYRRHLAQVGAPPWEATRADIRSRSSDG